MSDADTIREGIHIGSTALQRKQARSALDRLVAERDEARIMREHADVEAQTAREQRHAAEAERDRLQAFKDEALQTDWIARAEAAEARVTELEAANAELTVIAQVAHDVIIKAPDDVQKEFLVGISRGVAAKQAT